MWTAKYLLKEGAEGDYRLEAAVRDIEQSLSVRIALTFINNKSDFI